MMYSEMPEFPVVPPTVHPLWQGSISSKHMDRGSGLPRGLKQVESFARDGFDGVAAHGLGGYMHDTNGRLLEASMQGRRSSSLPVISLEAQWRPCRRTCVGPSPVEPGRLSLRPPFVPRTGSNVTEPAAQALGPAYDQEVDHFHALWHQREQQRARAALLDEARSAKQMVLGLEDWERHHLGVRHDGDRTGYGTILHSAKTVFATRMKSPGSPAGYRSMKGSSVQSFKDSKSFRLAAMG